MDISIPKFSPLATDDSVNFDTFRNSAHSRSRPWIFRLAILAALVVATSAGFLLGRRGDNDLRFGLLAPAGNKPQLFTYNRTYAMAPTEETATAWRLLYPENGGFIHHPELARNFSGIAVFHQLHCLQSLYYLYHNATSEGISGGAHHHSHEGGSQVPPPAHARHCFDYLRQALMCQADTNLEQYNYTLDGVTGWGLKQCRDYSAVMEFATQWTADKWSD